MDENTVTPATLVENVVENHHDELISMTSPGPSNHIDKVWLRETALRAVAQVNQGQGFDIADLLKEADLVVAWMVADAS